MTAQSILLCKTLPYYSIKRHLSGSDQLYQHCVISIFEILNLIDVHLNYFSPQPGLAKKKIKKINKKKWQSIFVSRPRSGETLCSK